MRQINALKEYLHSTTKRYNNGEELEVEFGDQPHVKYKSDGTPVIVVSPNVRDWLGKNIDEAQELRCIIDDTSHEVEHPRRTPQDAKREFMESYPVCPKTAGKVQNLLEDLYIDKKRTDKLKGLRKTRAFIIDRVLDNSRRHKKISSFDEREAAALEGIFQVSQAGYAKGISEVKDEEVKEFLAWLRDQCLQLKQIGGPDEEENIADDSIPGDGYYSEREEIYRKVMEAYLNLIGKENYDKAEDAADDMDMISGKSIDSDSLDLDTNKEADETDSPNDSSSDSIQSEEQQTEKESDNDENNSDSPLEETEEGDDGKEENDEPLLEDEQESLAGSMVENDDENDNKGGKSEGENEGLSEDSDQTVDMSQDSKEEREQDEEELDTSLDNSTNSGEHDQEREDEENPSTDSAGKTPRDETTSTEGEFEKGKFARTEDHLEEMEQMDEEDDVSEWFDVSSETDYTDIDNRFEERYEEIQKIKDRDNTATAEKIEKRENRIDNKDKPDRVYQRLEESGLADEIREAFEELKTRDEWIDTTRGQRVNTRKAVRRAAGDTTVEKLYKKKQRAEIGDRAISVALDLSGSMSEIEAKVALAGLQMASEIIGDQFTACGYKSFKPDGSNYNVVTTPLITAPNEEFDPSHLNAVWAGGRTPMASGIIEASELLQECTKSEDVLIVITDGKPNLTSDGYSNKKQATEEARQRVRELKRAGVKVVGIGIGSISPQQMDVIFEGEYVTTRMEHFAEKLVEVYYNQMKVV